MSTVTETHQKNSKLQELSYSIASSCEQAQSSEASRLGWLLEVAKDCDKFVALLNDELQRESWIASRRKNLCWRKQTLTV